VPRLNCTFEEFIEIIEARGFAPKKKRGGGSHQRYRGVVDGQVCFVDVGAHRINEHIGRQLLSTMIRQSGLPTRLFEK
jgi:predicted RNA binding protein YcfA (HicA-like mRNA interferase family)